MKRKSETSGMTLVEMAVGMFVASLVISGAYKLQSNITRSVERERDKSILLSEILNTGRLIERDIRSTGYGLPGNGLLRVIVDGNEELFLFTNSINVTAAITAQVNTGAHLLQLSDAQGFNVGDWVCIKNGDQVTYHTVHNVNIDDNRIHLENGVGSSIQAGAQIHRAESRRYFVDPLEAVLYRESNGSVMRISDRINTLNLSPRGNAGSDMMLTPQNAQSIHVTLGGMVRSGGNEQLYSETTEINIRNAAL